MTRLIKFYVSWSRAFFHLSRTSSSIRLSHTWVSLEHRWRSAWMVVGVVITVSSVQLIIINVSRTRDEPLQLGDGHKDWLASDRQQEGKEAVPIVL